MAAKHPAVSQAIRDAVGPSPARGVVKGLADATGKNPSNVSRWLSMASSPDSSLWPAIEQHLGMDAGHLERVASQPDELRAVVESLQQQVKEFGDVVEQLTLRLVRLEEGGQGGDVQAGT